MGPDLSLILIAIVAGLIIGCLICWLLMRGRLQHERQAGRDEQAVTIATLEARLAEAEKRRLQLENETTAARQRIGQLGEENAAFKSTLESERRNTEEKLNLLKKMEGELQTRFENLANQIFETKTRTFAEQSRSNLDAILKPFKEKISDFENKVTAAYTNEGKERHSLIKEVQRLQQLNQQISQDADNLTRALKGDTKTQGAWGEIVLERILEESGLRKGIEYNAQGGFRDVDGKLLKPDVIIHLPENKEIVIDSKVSLVAYERYVRAEDEVEREKALKEHLLSINAHLKGLESKRYDELPGVKSLDFVLMFIPIESAFMLAIEKDSEIFRKAFDQSIMIVSPSTLLVTLRTIENIWRYEHQNKNALEIADRAGKLYEKFAGFVEDLEKIGSQLETTRKTYDAAHNKLISGRGNLVSRAQGLIELGVKSRKSISSEALQDAALEYPEENED
ncbi:MAG: DNA recombination protein RmuC [Desulfuromonas sp.]|nr:MAG: DNA recombination protein RmuC [Desulfuromonas sp.]